MLLQEMYYVQLSLVRALVTNADQLSKSTSQLSFKSSHVRNLIKKNRTSVLNILLKRTGMNRFFSDINKGVTEFTGYTTPVEKICKMLLQHLDHSCLVICGISVMYPTTVFVVCWLSVADFH